MCSWDKMYSFLALLWDCGIWCSIGVLQLNKYPVSHRYWVSSYLAQAIFKLLLFISIIWQTYPHLPFFCWSAQLAFSPLLWIWLLLSCLGTGSRNFGALGKHRYALCFGTGVHSCEGGVAEKILHWSWVQSSAADSPGSSRKLLQMP